MVRREREKTTVEDVKQIFRVFDKVTLNVVLNITFSRILFCIFLREWKGLETIHFLVFLSDC